MPTYIVFIANTICSILFSWYLVVRVMFERIFIIYAHNRFEKFKLTLERICQFIFFTIFIFLLISVIPFLIHKLEIKVLNIVIDCLFIFIDFMFILTSLFYIIHPEFNFKEIKENGVDKYYAEHKTELNMIGSETSEETEKKYIQYKAQEWNKLKNFPVIKFLREDPRSFIYFVLSTIIAIFCLFL